MFHRGGGGAHEKPSPADVQENLKKPFNEKHMFHSGGGGAHENPSPADVQESLENPFENQ